jgi:hypothetical protein
MIKGNGVVTGWGYYNSYGQIINKTSRFLQKATVSFIDQKTCKYVLPDKYHICVYMLLYIYWGHSDIT